MASRPTRSLHWWVSMALIAFGLLMMLALSVQGLRSQGLVEHRIWRDILESTSRTYAQQWAADPATPLPRSGVLRSWFVQGDAFPSDVPEYLRTASLGHHSSEGSVSDIFDTDDVFHAFIAPLGGGRLITIVDIDELESQQNRDSLLGIVWAVLFIALIATVIGWLHHNLVRPVRDIAARMQAIDPTSPGERLPTSYRQDEIQVIARACNAHLDRVERFIARERSLLDQASHEFRTPLAVVSGAVDILRRQPLPEVSQPVVERIDGAVASLSEVMAALLYLARETPSSELAADVTAVHRLLPALVADHEHLLAQRDVRFEFGELEPTLVDAPEAMVRIALGNLLRNAAENTDQGRILVAVRDGVVEIADSGRGVDAADTARRYRESLRAAAPTRGQGLGLFLIGRICERFGWRLAIEPMPSNGTLARLDLGASLLPPTDLG